MTTVLDLKLYQGTLIDYAQSNDGTPTGVKWWQKSRLYAYFDGSTSEITCGSDSSLDVTGSYTMLVLFQVSSVSAINVLAGRYNGGVNRGLAVQLNASGNLQYLHCVQGSGEGGLQQNSITSASTYDDDEPHIAVCRFTSGTGAELFVDGSSVGTDTTYTGGISAFTQAFYLGRQSGGTPNRLDGWIGTVLLFNTALPNAEITKISKFKNYVTFNLKRRRAIIPSIVESRITQGLRAVWVLPGDEGTLVDRVNDIGDASVVDSNYQVAPAPGGRCNWLGNDSYYQFSYKATGGSLTHIIEFRTNESTQRDVFSRLGSVLRFNEAAVPGRVTWYPSVLGGPIFATGNMHDDLWHQIIVTHTGTSYQIFMDGISIRSGTGSAVKTDQTTFSDRIGAYFGVPTFGYIGFIKRVIVYDRVLNANEIKAIYQEFASIPVFLDDLKDAWISFANETSPNYLSNTRWKIDSGSWKIENLTGATFPGDKEIRCISAGVIYVTSTQAFGTWQFDIYKADTSNPIVMVVADTIGTNNTAGQDGYYFALGADESVYMGESVNGVATNKAVSAASMISHSTWYQVRVVRRYRGETTFYMKGGSFTDWTQIDVSGGSGTNPFTDFTTTTSNFFCLDLDAGDRVANFRFMLGEMHP